MYSARFLLKLEKSPPNHFLEQIFDLKCVVRKLTTAHCRTSSDSSKIRKWTRTYDCLHSSVVQKVPSWTFFSNLGRNVHLFNALGQKTATLHDPAKYRSKKVSIVTKSNDPDVFGDMEDVRILDVLEDKIGDESDFHEDSEIFIPEDRKYHSPYEYFRGMRDLVREKKLKQALQLFLDMKRHRVPPVLPQYTFMIGACGRAGYTEMAFKLLRQMTDKGFKPTSATLTGLFNSCAESPNIEYGLKKATFLKEKVHLKSWEVTVPTYHAMIKAFGRCGDIKTAFEIVDEMKESGLRITVETYSTLLISCVSDKGAGFTHAVEVWRKMISKKLHPNIFSYNLLLRAVRDCGVGPEEVSCNLLQHWSSYKPQLFGERRKAISREDVLTLPEFPLQNIKLIGDGDLQKKTAAKEKLMTDNESFPSGNGVIEAVTPTSLNSRNSASHSVLNLLSPRPTDGLKFIDLGRIKNAADRLLLIGGVKGILDLMKKDKVSPDIKTVTILLKILPDFTEHEIELLSLIESYQLAPDVDFFNILIKKRNFRKDFKAAKEVLVLMTKRGLHPDIVTFGVLAVGCTKKKDGLQLIHDMKTLGFCPNIEIFGALLNSASKQIDLEYICALLKAMKSQAIEPSMKFLQLLESIRNVACEKIVAMEQGKEISKLPFTEESYSEFCKLYDRWLKSTAVEEEVDPCLQYKTEIRDHVYETSYHVCK